MLQYLKAIVYYSRACELFTRQHKENNMSKSHDTKKDTKKKPQKTLEEKRQAKREKKNKHASV